jgi:hypothetical protein
MKKYSVIAYFLFIIIGIACNKNTTALKMNGSKSNDSEFTTIETTKNKSTGAANQVDIPKKMSDCIDPARRRLEKGCPDEIKEVCGCNGKTYRNKCEAEREGITYYSPGKCIPSAKE